MFSNLKKSSGLSLCKNFFVVAILFFSTVNFSTASAVVKIGDRGEEVKEVQICLIAQSLLSGEADGVCGAATVQAIKDFQSAVGLPVDGICGPETFRLLRAAAYGEIDITDFMVTENSSQGKNSQTVEVNEGSYAEVGEVIKQGSRGPGVVDVQNKLIAQGFLSGEADGVCGVTTVQAIKDFQASVGMVADGVCGIMTYAALENSQYTENDENWEETLEEFPQFKKTIRVEASAYSAQEPGIGIYTATGTRVRHGVIAVDPLFIPLGTRVYIPGYGEAIAEDTGGAIVGYKIDIAFETYSEALEFGKQTIEIYIIDD